MRFDVAMLQNKTNIWLLGTPNRSSPPRLFNIYIYIYIYRIPYKERIPCKREASIIILSGISNPALRPDVWPLSAVGQVGMSLSKLELEEAMTAVLILIFLGGVRQL